MNAIRKALPLGLLFVGVVAYIQGISIVFAKLFPFTSTYNYAYYLFTWAFVLIFAGFILRYYDKKKRGKKQ